MSFKEVKELRKSNRLEEALTMAQQDLDQEPDNIWNKRSIAWVYYDYLKENSSISNFPQFIDYLEKLNSLELPVDEKMVFDNCAYQVGKLLFELAKEDRVDYSKVNKLFDTVNAFHFTVPSESYTFLYKAFHSTYKGWIQYLAFADWWGFDNFCSQDYLEEEYKGKKIMSLVEQAHNAYAKKIIESNAIHSGPLSQDSNEQIIRFQTRLDKIIVDHPEYQYPPYYKARLMLEVGDNENVLQVFVPFAKQKRNDFWVWDLMSEIFPENDDRKIASLCKALSLKTPEDFLIKTREKLAYILIAKGFYNEAKTEIMKIFLVRKEKGWKYPEGLLNHLGNPNIKSAVAYNDNKVFYKKYVKIAEEILYHNIPEEIVAVEFVNSSKQMLHFIKDTNVFGFFKYSDFAEDPKIGDLLKVRGDGNLKNGFNKVLSIDRVLNDIETPVIKKFNGNIRVVNSLNIAFVDEVFIGSNFIDNSSFENNTNVTGKAILSYNKKKEEWGWKAFQLD